MITYQTQTQICIIVLFWDEGLYPYICHYSKTSFWLIVFFSQSKTPIFFHQQPSANSLSTPCALSPVPSSWGLASHSFCLISFIFGEPTQFSPRFHLCFRSLIRNCFFGVRKQSTNNKNLGVVRTYAFFWENLMNVFEFRLYRTNYIDSFHFFCICYYLFLTYAASHLELRKKTN